jgi:dihydrofolate reductase
MANFVYIAASLDGFIATSDGGVEWLTEIPTPENSDYGYAGFMSGIDAIIMGRNTFETVLAFGEWPYDKPVFVLSGSMTELPDISEGTIELVHGDIRTIISDLNRDGYKNLYIDGGRTIQSFLQEDLIDEMIVTRIPILLGTGIPLFGDMERSLKFQLVDTEVFSNMLVKSTYHRNRE